MVRPGTNHFASSSAGTLKQISTQESLEGSLVLGHTALELLAWVHVVVDKRLASIWLMGRMHDSNGSYDQAFVLFAALSVVAGFCMLRVTPDYWRSRIRSGEPESTESVTFERQYYT